MKLEKEVFLGLPLTSGDSTGNDYREDIASISIGYVDKIKEIMRINEQMVPLVAQDNSIDLTIQDNGLETEEYDIKSSSSSMSDKRNPFSGIILHPCMVNDPLLQQSYAPSINGMGTALSLAKICDFFVNHAMDKRLSPGKRSTDSGPVRGDILSMLAKVHGTELHMSGPREWGLGFLLDKGEGGPGDYQWIGFESQGSSCVVFSSPEAKITVAITLNKLTLSRKVAQTLTKIICANKGLRCPHFVVPDDDNV